MYKSKCQFSTEKIRKLWAVFATVALFGSINAASAQTLQSVETINLQDGAYQLRYHFDRNVGTPSHFVLKDKNLIVVDFKANGVPSNQKTKKIDNEYIKDITNIVNRNQVRSTIATKLDVVYNVTSSGNSVIVNINKPTGLLGAKKNWDNSVRANQNVVISDSVKDVSFFRNSQGAGVVDIYLPNAKIPVNVSEEKNRKVQLELQGHVWDASQNRRIDVTDFATPVSAIEIVNINGQAHVNVLTQANYEYSAQQVGAKYQLIVKPKVAKDLSKKTAGKRGEYTGELISINFQDIDVRAVLQIIADFTGLNIVVSDSVDSNITIRLQNVPWDQALDVVLQSKSLTKQQVGNVVFIMPMSEYKSTPKELITEIIQLNNAKAADVVKALVDGQGSGSSDQQKSPGISDEGSINIDPHQNLLIVRDTFEQIQVLRELILELDRPLKQVTISSQIVIAFDDYSRELGVKWGVGARSSNLYDMNEDGSIKGNSALPVGPAAMWDQLASDNKDPVSFFGNHNVWGGSSVPFEVGNNAAGLAVSILRRNFSANMELQALQEDGKGEIMASPTLTTTDRTEAYIRQGSEIPYKTVSLDGTQTEFKEVVMELMVRPHITPDNRIIMEIKVKKDEPSGQRTADGEIMIDKRELKTEAIVEDGETIVIGGIYQHTIREDNKKVPFFGDIPFIGNAFKNKANQNKKAEMIIFLTPNIVK